MEGKSVTPMGNPKKSGFPLPNWRITYSGLKNIPIISGQFTKFDIFMLIQQPIQQQEFRAT
jgi:hypothetical protein